MSTSEENQDTESLTVERRLRDEVLLLHPWHRKGFDVAVFDRKTKSLHGSKYSLYYQDGRVSIR